MTSAFTRGNPLVPKIYDALCGFEERRGLLEWRLRLVGDVSGEVLEIGAGTGRNLAHYPGNATVYATEFDPLMFGASLPRARVARATVVPLIADAQRLPFADESFDAVIVGLALCSIPDAARAVREVRRVLKPEGTFRFLEHVRDDVGTRRARLQDRVNPVWRFVIGGCNCNRRSADLVANSGFQISVLEKFLMGPSWIAPHVLGEAKLR